MLPVDHQRQPKWDPATESPPVPISRLTDIAVNNAFPGNTQPVEISYMEMKRLPASWSTGGFPEDRKDRWVCEFYFSQPILKTGGHRAFVMLDGTYLEPEAER